MNEVCAIYMYIYQCDDDCAKRPPNVLEGIVCMVMICYNHLINEPNSQFFFNDFLRCLWLKVQQEFYLNFKKKTVSHTILRKIETYLSEYVKKINLIRK